MVDPKSFTGVDLIGCSSRHEKILDPNYGSYWCRLQSNNYQTASRREGLQEQKKKKLFKELVSFMVIWNLQVSTKHGTVKGG